MPDSRHSYSGFKENIVHESSKLSTSDKNSHAELNSSKTGKRSSAAGALLKDKHPELFFVAPRPGGFIKNISSPRRDPSKTNVKEYDDKVPLQPAIKNNQYINCWNCISESVTRMISQYKNIKPMVSGTKTTPVSINEILDTQIPCPTFHRCSKDEERNNMVRMCSIAISTVIMLAQHTYKDITLEHVRHTEAYFRGLRQEDGYPQNIGQLMQILVNLKRGGKIVTPPPDQKDSDEEQEDTEDIQISDIIN